MGKGFCGVGGEIPEPMELHHKIKLLIHLFFAPSRCFIICYLVTNSIIFKANETFISSLSIPSQVTVKLNIHMHIACHLVLLTKFCLPLSLCLSLLTSPLSLLPIAIPHLIIKQLSMLGFIFKHKQSHLTFSSMLGSTLHCIVTIFQFRSFRI